MAFPTAIATTEFRIAESRIYGSKFHCIYTEHFPVLKKLKKGNSQIQVHIAPKS